MKSGFYLCSPKFFDVVQGTPQNVDNQQHNSGKPFLTGNETSKF